MSPIDKHPKLSLALTGIVCLTVIFVVNAFTLKVDNYFAIALVGIIAWLLGFPIGFLFRKK